MYLYMKTNHFTVAISKTFLVFGFKTENYIKKQYHTYYISYGYLSEFCRSH